MNESDIIDLRPLRDTAWAAHADRLADRIAGRLGSPPRPLPAPLQLAFEAAAGRVAIAAAVVILIGAVHAGMPRSSDPTLPTVTELIGGQREATAANVYLALRGHQP